MVSIIVPIYNVESHIEKCLRSLLMQSYKNIEYIFVNDCSVDNSMIILQDVVREFPDRFIKIINQPQNKGLAAARKTGIENSTGKYILHIDSDDWLHEDAVSLLYNKAEYERADIVVYDLRHVYSNSEIVEINEVGVSKEEYLKMILERQTSVNLVTKLFKANLCKKMDTLPIEGLNYGEDYVVLPRIVYYAEKIVKLNKVLYNYNHLNEQSYTNTVSRNSVINLMQAMHVLKTFFEKKKDGFKYKRFLIQSQIINNNILLTVCKDEDIAFVVENYEKYDLKYIYNLPKRHILLYTLSMLRFKFGIHLYRFVRKIKY